MKPRLIGLTGNMGSENGIATQIVLAGYAGRSIVAKLLAQLPGVAIYDVDQVWKELITTPICRHFVEFLIGKKAFVNDQPQYNVIASAMVADEEKRIILQTFAGMYVLGEIADRAQKSSATIHIVETAILFENGLHKLLSEIIVVEDCEEEPIHRSFEREQALRHMECLWSEREKIARANYVIDTFCSLPELEVRVRNLYNLLCAVRS